MVQSQFSTDRGFDAKETAGPGMRDALWLCEAEQELEGGEPRKTSHSLLNGKCMLPARD
jgi:hypothetical protein